MSQCTNPDCLSNNVVNLSYDSDEWVCNDCGEDFIADNGIHEDDLTEDF
jgi:transcription initiation factor TFIIIB Brf1 subunit/transcription initiation factor TFIIB